MKTRCLDLARVRLRLGLLGLTVATVLLLPRASSAATYDTWFGSADGYWSNNGNWSAFQGQYPSTVFLVGLIFDNTGFSRPISTNDLPGKTFDGILLYNSGYDLRGGAFGIVTTLYAGYTSGYSVIEPPVSFVFGSAKIQIINPGATLWLAGPVTVNNTALTVTNNGTLFANGSWSGAGSYSVNFTGPGTVQLAGDNNPLGGTITAAGTLVVFGGLSNAQVNVTGTLNGGGAIGRVALTGARLQPGYSFGTDQLTVLSNFTADAGSTLSFRMFGTDPGSYDRLRYATTNGTLSLGGAHLELLPGGTPVAGSQFKIIDKAGTNKVSGTFAGWPEGSRQFVGNAFYQISYGGGDGNDVVLTVTNVAAVWKGGGATTAWSLSSNWSNSVVPAANYDVIFPLTPTTFTASNDLAATQFNHLIFQGGNYHILGVPQIRGGIIDSNASIFNDNFIDTGVKLLADETWTQYSMVLHATNVVPGTNNLMLNGPGGFFLTSIGAGSGTISLGGQTVLVIFGSNSFSGTVQALDGYITLNPSCDLTASSGIVVSNGRVLMGGLAPSVTLVSTNASILLGGAAGTYNLAGNLDMQLGKFETVISSAALFRRLKVTGVVNIRTNIVLQIDGAYTPGVGESFSLLEDTGSQPIAGEFLGLPESSTFLTQLSSVPYRITYHGGDGNDLAIVAVPAPRVWSGADPAKLWSVGANWLSNSPPTAGSAMLFPTFVTSLSPTNDFPAFTRFESLSVSNSYTFHGNAIELGGGFILGYPAVFNPALRLAANQVWNVQSNFVVNGAVDLLTNRLNFAGGGSMVFSNNLTGSTGAVSSVGALASLTFNGTNNYAGVTRIQGGTFRLNGPLLNSPVRLDQADWVVTNSVLVSNSAVAFSGGAANQAVFAGALLNGSLAVTGGVFIVAAPGVVTNSPTTIAGGTLSVLGQMAASPITLLGGTLGGTGVVAGVTATGGTLAPGASPARLRTGNLSVGTGATVQLEIAGPVAGVSHDQLQVSGTVNLTNATLKLLLTEQTLSLGDILVLIDNDGSDPVVGTFAGLPENSTFQLGLLDVKLSYMGGTGNDVTLTVIGLIPRATWTGAANTNTWDNPTNWARNTLPLAGDNLYFPPGVPNLTNANTLGATSYAAIVLTGSNYLIQAGNAFLSAGIVAANLSGTNIVDSMFPGPASTISNASGNTLVLTGQYDDAPLNFLTFGDLEFRGDLLGGSNLVMAGAGTLHLYNTNQTFSGDIRLQAGLTEANDAGSLGASFANRNLAISNGATLAVKAAGGYGGTVFLGGTLRVSAPDVVFNQANIITHTNSSYFVDVGASLTLAGPVGSAFGLRKDGPGEMTMLLTNIYSGATYVNAGTLFISGLATGPPAPSVNVSPGATLRGGGPVGPVFVNQGVLAPGFKDAYAALSSHDGVALGSQSIFRVRLGNVPDGFYDRLNVTGPVVLAVPQLQLVQDFRPPVGASFTIIVNDGGDPVFGTFSGLPQNSFYTNGPAVFQVLYNAGGGNDVAVVTDHYLSTGLTRTWTGAGTNAVWSNADNWSGSVAPQSGDALFFPPGALQLTNQNDFPTNTFFDAITFGDTFGYRLTGNLVALIGGCLATNSSGTNTLALPLAILTNMLFRCEQPAATLAFAAPLDSNSRTLILGGGGTILGLGPVVGLGGVDMAGPGLAELRGTNTFSGETRVSGGRLRFQNSTLGQAGGGVVVTNGAILELSATTNVAENFTMSGTLLFTNAPIINVQGQFRFPTNSTGVFDVAAGTLANISATFAADGGGPAKEGPGDLYLLAADLKEDAYSGPAMINAGRLIFDSQTKGLTPDFGDLVVNSGGTLAATGQVNRIVVNPGGTLAPGLFSGVGPLSLQRGLTMSPGSTLVMDLQGVDPSLDIDSITVSGGVNLNNATLQVILGYDAVLDSQYQIINTVGGAPINGHFAGLAEDSTFFTANSAFNITYLGGDGNDVVLTYVAAPPAITSFGSLPDGRIQIAGTALPGWYALLEATANLTPPVAWEILDFQIPDGSGLVSFTDNDATNHAVRFYRIIAP